MSNKPQPQTIEQAENTVLSNENLRWEGWDIISHKPTARLRMFSRDMRYNRETGRWGFEKVIRPNSKGLYYI